MDSKVPDWQRETPGNFSDPSRKLLQSIRYYQRLKQKKGFIALVLSKLCVVQHGFWTVITGVGIICKTII
jgi:hypothetical protein